MFWRTAETKSRRTYSLMEVITVNIIIRPMPGHSLSSIADRHEVKEEVESKSQCDDI